MHAKRNPAAIASFVLILAVLFLALILTARALMDFGQERPDPKALALSASSPSPSDADLFVPSSSEEELFVPSSSGPEPAAEPEPAAPAGPDDWRLILVNAQHPIPDDFTVALADTPYGYQVDARIKDDLVAMIEGARADGVQLLICYGYRTKAQSQYLYEKQINQQLSYGLSREQAEIEAAKWVAPPGTSDHHTGLALDIVTPSYQTLDFGFAETDAAKWMAAHAYEYGFVLRFPEDKQEITGIVFEPWHYRYVGKEHAAVIQEKGLCLEEYVAETNGQGAIA